MSLVSGITFGGLLAYGASRTSADPKDFIFLLGRVLQYKMYHHQYVRTSQLHPLVSMWVEPSIK